MIVGFMWFLGLAALISLVVLQFYVLSLISDFEVKGMNPIESSVSLNKTTKPSILIFAITVITSLFDIGRLWGVILFQLLSGGYFFYTLNDKSQWFEPRYLFRDLDKIKIRHCVVLISSTVSALWSLLVMILKK